MIMQTLDYLKAKFRCTKGIGTIEVILLIFILVGVVVMFRKELLRIAAEYIGQLDPEITRETVK